ncbi:MAG: DUF3465 domain-containing protein [Thiotrichales bacterium]
MKKSGYGVWGVVLVLGLLGAQYLVEQWEQRTVGSPKSGGEGDGAEVLRQAFAQERSKLWMEVAGQVAKTLPDDNKGSRHQRFLLQVPGNETVLVAHNIDLADYVPLRKGDPIRIRGRYEWNEKGGVLHWTHHDPRGHIEGGWIRHAGTTYR